MQPYTRNNRTSTVNPDPQRRGLSVRGFDTSQGKRNTLRAKRPARHRPTWQDTSTVSPAAWAEVAATTPHRLDRWIGQR